MTDENITPEEDARFGPLKAKAEDHWRTHNKKRVRLLESKGELDQILNGAVAQAIFIMNQAEEKGLAPDQARELAYEGVLPPEE